MFGYQSIGQDVAQGYKNIVPTSKPLTSYERILALHDTEKYLFFEFDTAGGLIRTDTFSGKELKEQIYDLTWHKIHKYRILDKKGTEIISLGFDSYSTPAKVQKVLTHQGKLH